MAGIEAPVSWSAEVIETSSGCTSRAISQSEHVLFFMGRDAHIIDSRTAMEISSPQQNVT